MKVFIVLITVSSLFLSGCATILTGTTERIKFTSEPDATHVDADGQSCATPCSLNLKKGESHMAKFKHAGYETQTVALEKKFNPVSLLNLLGMIGWIVDVATGAMWSVSPDAINANLVKSGSKTQK